jgi:hypothetical protein
MSVHGRYVLGKVALEELFGEYWVEKHFHLRFLLCKGIKCGGYVEVLCKRESLFTDFQWQ